MRRSVSHVSRRGGFTLVELLVVITIIAILFALLSAAAVKLIGKGDEVKLRSEISQLAQAVQAFKQQFSVGYIPDQIYLPPGFDPSAFLSSTLRASGPGLTQCHWQFDSNFTINGVNYPQASRTGAFPAIRRYSARRSITCLLARRPARLISTTAPGNVLGFCTDSTDPMNRNSTKQRLALL